MEKKNNLITTIIIIVLIVLFIGFLMTVYTIDETEQVVITQFGRVVGEPLKDAGLHFKLPWQSVNKFEKRILQWDGIPTQIPDLEKKNIIIDTFARWEIKDPKQFLISLQGDEREAQARLDNVIEASIRDIVTTHPIIELIRNSNRKMKAVDVGSLVRKDEAEQLMIEKGRDALQDLILANAKASIPDIGIAIIDIRIKRINYVDSVRSEIYRRMISERNRIAERYRSEGAGAAREIDGKRQRTLETIISEANRKMLEITGEADGKAAKIYADAYSVDAEFYAFWKTLESYRESIDENAILIFSTMSDFSKYMQKMVNK
ncbi:MAG: protease modulator HflC [Acidobacteria bacterium]|nr:protease modulator HflC [Acidobacteriota bacterium]